MKHTLSMALLVALFTTPLMASATDAEVFEGEYLNVSGSELAVLNIAPLAKAKSSDLNEWGSHWGSKIPFKGNVPHGVAAYGVDVSTYFPKF